jgi:two-component system response regulator HupR/HoxA
MAVADTLAARPPEEIDQAILVVDDEPASVNLLRITLGMDHRVYTATDGPSGLDLLAAHPDIALAIVDQRMPGMSGTEFIQQTIDPYPHLIRIILTGYTDIESLIQAINAGRVYRYLTKPWDRDELVGTVQQGLELHRLAAENARLHERLKSVNAILRVENAQLRRESRERHRFDGIIGNSPALRRTLDLVERVAVTDSTVLLLSETGTGKELVARAIHYNGPRAERPFVAENCGALAPDLLTSELFGHKRGAFTGAGEDRQGLFEVAHGGTLFLDEIGDCPPELQTRLLRVLDHGEIRRVGENTPRKVDVRIVAATHHDLESEVEQGRFRRDLYFRLSVFTIQLPPLRERKEDIALLAEHFIDALNRPNGKRVLGCTPETLSLLSTADFPGNVRELENEIERAWVLADNEGYITPDLLSPRFAAAAEADSRCDQTLRGKMERFEEQVIRDALVENAGNQTRTAVALGVSRRALIDKINKYGISGRD